LGIQKAAEAIDFYKKAFNATEVMRLAMPDGGIGHAELRINGQVQRGCGYFGGARND